jgi:thioesterase domain-containing protein
VAGLTSIIGEKSISGELPEQKAQKDNLLFKLELGCAERLNRGNNHKNIFFIHPLHGMVNQYKELAVLLEKDYNVYGIQARGLSPGTTMAESPEDMVNDYLEQIMAVQEKGLYIIGGYCVGNLIAYTIVKRLEKLNHQVEKLILIDGGAFSGPFITTIRTLEYLPGSIKKRIFSSNEKRFHKKLKKLNHPGSEETSDKSEFGEDKVRKYIRLLTSYLLPPGIIKAPILVPIAKEDNYPPATEEQFSKMTKSKTTVIECPGDHNSIFEEPYVENLAEILKNNI